MDIPFEFYKTVEILTKDVGNVYYLNFDVKPTPKGRPRISKWGRVFTPSKTREFEETMRLMASQKWERDPLEGAIGVAFCFCLKRPKTSKREHPTVKPDLDNFVKASLDAFQEILYRDDCHIVECLSQKIYAETEGIVVALWKVPTNEKSPQQKSLQKPKKS